MDGQGRLPPVVAVLRRLTHARDQAAIRRGAGRAAFARAQRLLPPIIPRRICCASSNSCCSPPTAPLRGIHSTRPELARNSDRAGMGSIEFDRLVRGRQRLLRLLLPHRAPIASCMSRPLVRCNACFARASARLCIPARPPTASKFSIIHALLLNVLAPNAK